MPERWTLRYHVVEEAMQHRCRLHFGLFQRDPHVDNVLFGTPPNNPEVRLIQVNFKEGFTAPHSVALRHLNNLFALLNIDIERDAYPTIGRDEQAVIDQQVLQDLHESRQVIHAKTEPGKALALSPEFSSYDSWKRGVPEWCYAGKWLREKTSNLFFEVLRVTLGASTTVTVQEWRRFTPYCVSIQSIKDLYVASVRPKDPETWHFRLMGDDIF